MSTVLVTGAAGYIGGQTMLELRDRGHRVIAVDRRPLPEHLRSVPDEFLEIDFARQPGLYLITQNQCDAVVHCAGTSLVAPSMTNPEDYYENNFVKTKRLADYIVFNQPRCRLIFSSSAAVYGSPIFTPCHEPDPIMPISPYGESKAMIEWMLAAYHRSYGLDYVSFRYFNACGADLQQRHGQEPGATHIIARALESARDNTEFQLYGTDYETDDGTCVRDYVHVADIACAHAQAVDTATPSGVFNLSTAQGHSNLQILRTAQQVTDREIWITRHLRREGDPAVLTASAEAWNRATGWQPQHSLEEIVQSAWKWYLRGI